MSPIFRSRKSDRKVRAADRRRSWRCRSSSKTSVSAMSCRPAAPSLKPCESRPCATTTAAPRIDSVRSMFTATTSYSRNSSIVRSARPVVATTNTTVSRRSRARLMSATQSCTRPRYSGAGCTSTCAVEATAASARRGRSSAGGSSAVSTSSAVGDADAAGWPRSGVSRPSGPACSTASRAPASSDDGAPPSASSSSLTAPDRRSTRVDHGSASAVGSGAIGLRASASA